MVDTPREPSPAATVSPGRVLLVTTTFPPNRQAGTHRLLRFTRHLSALGWRVTVLTMDPASYRAGVPLDERLNGEIPPDVEIVRTRVPGRAPVVRPPTTSAAPAAGARVASRRRLEWLRRQWRDVTSTPDPEWPWALTAVPAGIRAARRSGATVILSSGPPFTCHLIASAIAARTRLPWVADFRDPWARAPWALDVRDRGWTGVVHRRLERSTIVRASRVVLNTRNMQDDFARHHPDAVARLLTIPNGYDQDALDRGVRPIQRTAPDDTIVLCHTGNLYQARDPRPLLRALAGLRTRGDVPPDAFRLQLVGGAGGEFDAAAEVERLGLRGVVEFVPPVSHGESLGYLRAADVLLVVQPDTAVQVPVKLYEYVWARKPILALASPGAVADLVTDGHVGLVVAADDDNAIGAALLQLHRRRATLASDFRAPDAFLAALEGGALTRRLDAVLRELSA